MGSLFFLSASNEKPFQIVCGHVKAALVATDKETAPDFWMHYSYAAYSTSILRVNEMFNTEQCAHKTLKRFFVLAAKIPKKNSKHSKALRARA